MKAFTTVLLLAIGIGFTAFIMIVFTPFFRESGSSANTTVGIGNFYGMYEITVAWPLIMWAIPVGILATVALVVVWERRRK